MKLKEVMVVLKAKGSKSTKRILLAHGAREPSFGVVVGELKPIAQQIKGAQALASELYATVKGDAHEAAAGLGRSARDFGLDSGSSIPITVTGWKKAAGSAERV